MRRRSWAMGSPGVACLLATTVLAGEQGTGEEAPTFTAAHL